MEACLEELILQARKIRSGGQRDERPSSGAEQKETRRAVSIREFEGIVKKGGKTQLRAHLFDTAVLPTLK
uniref:Transposase n=1 Tax=Haemonchus contortus TaxID=6289 RepID=A0A7I4YDR3_HAECO